MRALTVMLMRHGHAVDDAPTLGDEGRWLTEKGRERTRDVARRLSGWKRTPEVIFTSPLVRAVQTAEIVAAVLEHRGAISALADLVVDGRPRAVSQWIHGYEGAASTMLLVGHEPSLSVLANILLGEHRWEGFKKSQLLALAIERGTPGAKVVDTIDP
jgi:phosphohistidine phosphatase